MSKKRKGESGAGAGGGPSSGTFRKLLVSTWGRAWFRALPGLAQLLWIRLFAGPERSRLPGLAVISRLALADWAISVAGLRGGSGNGCGNGSGNHPANGPETPAEPTPDEVGRALGLADDLVRELQAAGQLAFDWTARLVFSPFGLEGDAPQNPNQVVGLRRHWDDLPDSPLKSEWLAHLARTLATKKPSFRAAFLRAFGDLGVPLPEGFREGLGNGSPNGYPNKEKETEIQKETETEIEKGGDPRAGAREQPPPPSSELPGEDTEGEELAGDIWEAAQREALRAPPPDEPPRDQAANLEGLARLTAYGRELAAEAVAWGQKLGVEVDRDDAFRAIVTRCARDWMGAGKEFRRQRAFAARFVVADLGEVGPRALDALKAEIRAKAPPASRQARPAQPPAPPLPAEVKQAWKEGRYDDARSALADRGEGAPLRPLARATAADTRGAASG